METSYLVIKLLHLPSVTWMQSIFVVISVVLMKLIFKAHKHGCSSIVVLVHHGCGWLSVDSLKVLNIKTLAYEKHIPPPSHV